MYRLDSAIPTPQDYKEILTPLPGLQYWSPLDSTVCHFLSTFITSAWSNHLSFYRITTIASCLFPCWWHPASSLHTSLPGLKLFPGPPLHSGSSASNPDLCPCTQLIFTRSPPCHGVPHGFLWASLRTPSFPVSGLPWHCPHCLEHPLTRLALSSSLSLREAFADHPSQRSPHGILLLPRGTAVLEGISACAFTC